MSAGAGAGGGGGSKRPFQTDVSRPARLPTGRLDHARALARPANSISGAGGGPGTDAQIQTDKSLDELSEKVNKLIDDDIEVLLEAFRSFLELLRLADKGSARIAHDSFQMQIRADSMVRATQHLLQISRALSTSLLLSRSSDASEASAAGEDIDEQRRKCAHHVQRLLAQHQ